MWVHVDIYMEHLIGIIDTCRCSRILSMVIIKSNMEWLARPLITHDCACVL